MRKKQSAWSKEATTSISGQFAPRLIEMLKSPAYRALSLAAHMILARIEIELAHHSGNGTAAREANGKISVTYAQFEDYGLQHGSIAPAIRELEALGFIERTQRGCGGNASFKQLSLYRLTHRHAVGVPADGSHEWRRIADRATAEAVVSKLEIFREDQGQKVNLEKQNPRVGKWPRSGQKVTLGPGWENGLDRVVSQARK